MKNPSTGDTAFGRGPIIFAHAGLSPDEPIVLGIDEAGRGSVVGPMIYGMAYWSANNTTSLPPGLTDSKQLSEKQRSHSFHHHLVSSDAIGLGVRVLHASEISRNMLRQPDPYNLNQQSHDAAMALIQGVMEQPNVVLQTCYIDTVGNPQAYHRKLQAAFPNVEFVVESKADDTYAVCSAASIVAKVVRDAMVEALTEQVGTTSFGSGYPSDPACKQWLKDQTTVIPPLFGFSPIVRFSWGPAKQQLLQSDGAVAVEFVGDNEEEDDEAKKYSLGSKRQQRQMLKSFVSGRKKRLPYLERRGITPR